MKKYVVNNVLFILSFYVLFGSCYFGKNSSKNSPAVISKGDELSETTRSEKRKESTVERFDAEVVEPAVTTTVTSEESATKSISPDDPSIRIKPKDSDEKPVGNTEPVYEAGVLTAGEWADLAHWDFWLTTIADKEWTYLPQKWGIDTQQKITVVVKNNAGEFINDVPVILELQNGESIWQARTDNKGKAQLFTHFDYEQSGDYTVKIIGRDGAATKFRSIDGEKRELYLEIVEQSRFSKNLDIMFVVDATGSMGDEIDFLKAELGNIITQVNNKAHDLETRLSLVFYRDREDEYLVRDFEFNTNIQLLINQLNLQNANGGGDFPEAVEAALENAIEQKRWSENASARLLFLILDAPPHEDPAVLAKYRKQVKQAAQKGIKIIPIVASGIDKPTEFLMRFTAIATDGTYVFLTDDSGVGNSHLKPTIGRYQIEKLNDLIVRLILDYANVRKV